MHIPARLETQHATDLFLIGSLIDRSVDAARSARTLAWKRTSCSWSRCVSLPSANVMGWTKANSNRLRRSPMTSFRSPI